MCQLFDFLFIQVLPGRQLLEGQADPNWFLASVAQCTAAIIALISAVLASRLIEQFGRVRTSKAVILQEFAQLKEEIVPTQVKLLSYLEHDLGGRIRLLRECHEEDPRRANLDRLVKRQQTLHKIKRIYDSVPNMTDISGIKKMTVDLWNLRSELDPIRMSDEDISRGPAIESALSDDYFKFSHIAKLCASHEANLFPKINVEKISSLVFWFSVTCLAIPLLFLNSGIYLWQILLKIIIMGFFSVFLYHTLLAIKGLVDELSETGKLDLEVPFYRTQGENDIDQQAVTEPTGGGHTE